LIGLVSNNYNFKGTLPELKPSIFRDMSSLKHLVVRNYANLKRIARHTFKSLVNVETIDLNTCAIFKIDSEAFSSLQRLKVLNLSYNRLPKFEARLPCNLECLLLVNNALVSLDGVFSTANSSSIHKKLAVLDLKENKLKSIPSKYFSSLVALRFLNLARNEISEISAQAFTGLANLREIDLSENKIKVIQAGLFSSATPYLNKLALDETSLERVEQGAFSNLHDIVQITLEPKEPNYKLLKPFEDAKLVELASFYGYYLSQSYY
jgi:Leucine-rich repeat (LRR) protein